MHIDQLITTIQDLTQTEGGRVLLGVALGAWIHHHATRSRPPR